MAPAGAVSERIVDPDPRCLKSLLLPLVISLNFNLKTSVSEFLYRLCDEDCTNTRRDARTNVAAHRVPTMSLLSLAHVSLLCLCLCSSRGVHSFVGFRQRGWPVGRKGTARVRHAEAAGHQHRRRHQERQEAVRGARLPTRHTPHVRSGTQRSSRATLASLLALRHSSRHPWPALRRINSHRNSAVAALGGLILASCVTPSSLPAIIHSPTLTVRTLTH